VDEARWSMAVLIEGLRSGRISFAGSMSSPSSRLPPALWDMPNVLVTLTLRLPRRCTPG
jgi:hypothetical protein